MIPSLREWRRNRWLRLYPLPEKLWGETVRAVPMLDPYRPFEIERLRALTTVFLHEKDFIAAHDLELNDAMRLRIALLASIPILNLDLDWYRGWKTVIVYPGEFIHRREHTDAMGLVHRWEEVLSGESWERGPLILSWADVEASGQLDGYNVVKHEAAHKLDMLNGLPDGFPPLHRGMEVRRWTQVLTAAFDDLNRRLDAGLPTDIDSYAGSHPAEFFAVISEYFFELPEVVAEEYADVYKELRDFYRQDPLERLSPN
jgi:Mlc titration factor MtfA (ptsG expression regulator)